MDDFIDEDSFNSDEDSGLLKKALDVHLPGDFNPNSVPRDGHEYLHHVIYERNKCKKWVTSHIDPEKLKKSETFNIPIRMITYNIPLHLLPSLEWQNKKLTDFKQFREALDNVNGSYNSTSTITTFNEEKFFSKLQTTAPQYSTFCQYTQPAKIRMMELITNYISKNKFSEGFVGAWIFAVLATLVIPLSPGSCHAIREFIRTCQFVRSKLSENEEKTWAALNFYICISSRYFGQLDLADLNISIV